MFTSLDVCNLLCIVGLKVGNGNCGTDFDQSLGEDGSSALLCSSVTFPELMSGAMYCSLALLAQCRGRGGGRGAGSSMSVSCSSPVSVLDATDVRLPEEISNVL